MTESVVATTTAVAGIASLAFWTNYLKASVAGDSKPIPNRG